MQKLSQVPQFIIQGGGEEPIPLWIRKNKNQENSLCISPFMFISSLKINVVMRCYPQRK
jgi:hypothetical protein